MLVRILTAGKYNGQNLRAQDCKVGDVLDTRQWYGENLIEGGLAEEVAPEPVEEPKKAKAAARTKKAPGAKAEKPVDKNVFLE
jgi:hypothetical protein